jgi:hypothetical protein
MPLDRRTQKELLEVRSIAPTSSEVRTGGSRDASRIDGGASVDARNPEKKKPALLLPSAGFFKLPNQLTGDFSSFRFSSLTD